MDISKVANDYSFTYLEPTAISLSSSRQLQVFLSSFRYSQPTAIIVIYAHQFELITNFKSDRLLILIVRTAVQAIASISIQVHIIRPICFPPTSHCTYFNATAILSIVMHAYVSRKLQLFQYNCTNFDPTALVSTHSTILNQQ